MKFDPYGVLMINRIFIAFQLYCCGKQKLLTIFIANYINVANLDSQHL